jgi:hypothetical protein
MATHEHRTYTYTCDLCGGETNKEELTPVQFRKGRPPTPQPTVARATTQRAFLARPAPQRAALQQPLGYDTGRSSQPPVIDICQQCASRPISDLLAYEGSPIVRNNPGDGPQEQPRA